MNVLRPVDTMALRLAVLGPVQAWRGGREVGLGTAQQRLLLALLVAHAGRPVPMDELVDVLWGESPPASSANGVYRHIGALRRLLEPGLPLRAPGSVLVRESGGYRLAAEDDAVDLLRFRALLRRARAAARRGQDAHDEHEPALPLFLAALALCTGPVATGIPPEARSHPVFVGVEHEYLTAVKEAADAALAGGGTGHVLTVLHRTAAEHPFDEQLHARLVRALAATGQRAEALDAWQRIRVRLGEELGIAPGAELRAAQAEILSDDTSAPATPDAPRTLTLVAGIEPTPTWLARGRPSTGFPRPGGVTVRVPAQRIPSGARSGRSGQPDGRSEARGSGTLRSGRAADRTAGPPHVDVPHVDVRTTNAASTPRSWDAQPSSAAERCVRPAQLPADLNTFAGRHTELAQLSDLLEDPEPATRIAVISGMGGIGKTTLAMRWSHRIAHRFPDGQLYVNLRGFDPEDTVTAPGEALRGFLEALGVPSHRLPVDTAARAALYRSLLAGRQVLVLLDNARDAEQVRPLLPGSAGCLAVVTSRDSLFGLVAVEAARPVILAPLQPPAARETLVRRLGPDRVSAEPHAVDEIIAHCAGLPLALAVVATRAAAHPGFPLAVLAAELREAHGSLDAFADPEPTSDVRTVFSWSYRALAPDAARLLRLLSLHPGPDVTAPVAAATAGTTLAKVRPLLADLTRAHLLTAHTPGRYSCHDLVRTYARELAETHDATAERDAAVSRLLDHHAHTPSRTTSPLTETRSGPGGGSPYSRPHPLPTGTPR